MDDFVALWDHRYTFLDGKVNVTIHEDFDAGLGGTLFDGSVALTSFLERLVRENGEELFVNKDVIELGAGCGFPGLLAGKLGAKVVLTDIGGPPIELLAENIENNELTETSTAVALDWFSDSDLQALPKDKFDYILAADTIYSIEAVEPFLKACVSLSHPQTQILFSHPKARVPEASERFWNEVGNYFTVEKVHADRFVRDHKQDSKQFLNEHQGVFILRLK